MPRFFSLVATAIFLLTSGHLVGQTPATTQRDSTPASIKVKINQPYSLKQKAALKGFVNRRAVKGMITADEETDKKNERYYEINWYKEKDVFSTSVTLKRPFLLKKNTTLEGVFIRKATEQEIAAGLGSEAGLGALGAGGAQGGGEEGQKAAGGTNGGNDKGNTNNITNNPGTGSNNPGSGTGTNNPTTAPTLASTSQLSCPNKINYTPFPGTVEVQEKTQRTYSDGSTRVGNCATTTTYPINFLTDSCPAKPDYGRRVAVQYGRKTYNNGQSNVELSSCVPGPTEFPLMSEKANCTDSYNPATNVLEYRKKFYYTADGLKSYVSDCLLTSESGTYPGPILRELSTNPRVDRTLNRAYQQERRYVEVDGQRYYIDANFVDTAISWPLVYDVNVCGDSYTIDVASNKAFYQKQLGFRADGAWKAIGGCEPDANRAYNLVTDKTTCDITIRRVPTLSMVIQKRTYFIDGEGRVKTVSGCTETDEVVPILAADIERDYTLCAETLDPLQNRAFANYVQSIRYGGKKYSLSDCIKSNDSSDIFYYQRSTQGCSPTLDIANMKAYERAYTYYRKGTNEVKVGDCSATNTVYPLLKSTTGCMRGLSPDGQNFIINVYYYYNLASGPVSVTGCQQDTSLGYVPITDADIVKNYDDCPYYIDLGTNFTAAALRQARAYQQYASYVNLGGQSNNVRIRPCIPDMSLGQPVGVTYDNCRAAVHADNNSVDTANPYGYVSPQVNLTYIDRTGATKVLRSCIETQDRFAIRKENTCAPNVVSQGPPPVYLVMVKRFYINAANDIVYLDAGECRPDVVNGDPNQAYATEIFCGENSANPLDVGARFSIDIASNLVQYRTRWSYYTVTGNGAAAVYTEHALVPCAPSWTKRTRVLTEAVCGYEHNDQALVSAIWRRKQFRFDASDSLANQRDLGKAFTVLGNGSVVDASTAIHAQIYTVYGLVDTLASGGDASAAYLRTNCSPYNQLYQYVRTRQDRNGVKAELRMYSFSAAPTSNQADPLHNDYLLSSYSSDNLGDVVAHTEKQGLNPVDLNYPSLKMSGVYYAQPVGSAYQLARYQGLKVMVKNNQQDTYSRIDGTVLLKNRDFVHFGKISVQPMNDAGWNKLENLANRFDSRAPSPDDWSTRLGISTDRHFLSAKDVGSGVYGVGFDQFDAVAPSLSVVNALKNKGYYMDTTYVLTAYSSRDMRIGCGQGSGYRNINFRLPYIRVYSSYLTLNKSKNMTAWEKSFVPNQSGFYSDFYLGDSRRDDRDLFGTLLNFIDSAISHMPTSLNYINARFVNYISVTDVSDLEPTSIVSNENAKRILDRISQLNALISSNIYTSFFGDVGDGFIFQRSRSHWEGLAEQCGQHDTFLRHDWLTFNTGGTALLDPPRVEQSTYDCSNLDIATTDPDVVAMCRR